MSRGSDWFERLAQCDGRREDMPPSIRVADANLGDERIRFTAVVPDTDGRFPRARRGELGIDQGWALAAAVREAIDADTDSARKKAIVAIVDVPGQAFGYREEVLELQTALAASVDAYATARTCGHPVVALLVGRAISGAFLAHGMQAGAIVALDDPELEVHVMSAPAVARVTQRSADEVARLAQIVPSTARDIASFASLGGIVARVSGDRVADAILTAIASLRERPREPRDRLSTTEGRAARVLSDRVRAALRAEWNSASTISSGSTH